MSDRRSALCPRTHFYFIFYLFICCFSFLMFCSLLRADNRANINLGLFSQHPFYLRLFFVPPRREHEFITLCVKKLNLKF